MSTRSKEIIANSLIDLMRKYTFKEITISEICSNTSLVRKTFYNNFNTKEEVLSFYFNNLLIEYQKIVLPKTDYSVKEASLCFFRFGKMHNEQIKLLIDNNLFYLCINNFNKRLSTLNKKIMSEKNNCFSPDELKYLNIFNSSGLCNLLKLWIISDFDKTEQEMSNIYCKLFCCSD